jgi:rRNA maturation endonuclease Nob1
MKVVNLVPTFPNVRCNQCFYIYKIDSVDFFAKGNCPMCGHQKFSTVVEGTSGIMVNQNISDTGS